MDEGCSYPIQQGAKLSRARVFSFRHNDAEDLAALLERLEAEQKRERCGVCSFPVLRGSGRAVWKGGRDVAALLERLEAEQKRERCGARTSESTAPDGHAAAPLRLRGLSCPLSTPHAPLVRPSPF